MGCGVAITPVGWFLAFCRHSVSCRLSEECTLSIAKINKRTTTTNTQKPTSSKSNKKTTPLCKRIVIVEKRRWHMGYIEWLPCSQLHIKSRAWQLETQLSMCASMLTVPRWEWRRRDCNMATKPIELFLTFCPSFSLFFMSTGAL